MITDDDVMRLFEQADPERHRNRAPEIDATRYLAALRTRSETVTIVETAPESTEQPPHRRWLTIAGIAAAIVLIIGAAVMLAGRDHGDDQIRLVPPDTSAAPPDTAATLPEPTAAPPEPTGTVAEATGTQVPGTTGPTAVPPSPDEVAAGFLDAYTAFDADRALEYLSDAAVTTMAGSVDQFRLDLQRLQAVGYKELNRSCETGPASDAGTPVTCSFLVHELRSDENGFDPSSGGRWELVVRDGVIESARPTIEYTNRFTGSVLEPFAEWIRAEHPADAAVMYSDAAMTTELATAASIPLWEQRSSEYADRLDATSAEAEQIATEFVDAFGSLDADRTIAMLPDEAVVDSLYWSPPPGPGAVEGLREVFKMLTAMGYLQERVGDCTVEQRSVSGAVVRCNYDYYNLRAEQVGRGPFPNSSFEVTVDDGTIVRVERLWSTVPFSGEMWEPFYDWVRAAFDISDAAIMYGGPGGSPLLTDESYALWDQHTRDYVAAVNS